MSIPAALSQALLGYSATLANLWIIITYLCRKGLPFLAAMAHVLLALLSLNLLLMVQSRKALFQFM